MASMAQTLTSIYRESISNKNDGLKGYNIYRHPKGMQLQLKWNDKEQRKYVIIAKIKINEVMSSNIEEFINNHGSDELKIGKYQITSEIFNKLKNQHQMYNSIIAERELEASRSKVMIECNGVKKTVSHMAKDIHDIADKVELLVSSHSLNVLEAQDFWQAMYRIEQMLTAYKMPQELFQHMLFANEDKKKKISNSFLKNYVIASFENAKRFFPYRSDLDHFDKGENKKKIQENKSLLDSYMDRINEDDI
ncbi:hypothetical protein GNP73_13920 [Aliivibrio fischeri]|uniref:hypothetical protein n=1 Tax=Aliivibrio fischeri TaxID=668 RepID=UPI0012DAB47C|nr:hypothetical protein [Aliivibrio fischeri]MUJ29068.1 hypothetical protein [Aliivibrio fischeri]